MNILIVAATSIEIQPAIDYLNTQRFRIPTKEVDYLITGIGGIATTYNLTRSLYTKKPHFIIQAGVAGSFRPDLKPGSVVCVDEDLFGDLGVIEDNRFKDLFDLGLMGEDDIPFTRKILKNPEADVINESGLRKVRSISINEITTKKERIELIRQKYNPDIESMEGGAFHYVCLREKIPFLQIRAVSNYVGERNKEKWQLQESIKNLNEELTRLITVIT